MDQGTAVMRQLLAALVFILILMLSWGFIVPIFEGVVPVVGGMVWSILVSSVIVMCVAILLLFVITGLGFVVVGSVAFTWVALAVVFFPVLLPILLPLFITWLFISYFRRQQQPVVE